LNLKPDSTTDAQKRKKTLKDMIVAFLMPTLFGKVCVLYFGIHYSRYPDEGYGWGLAAAIVFTVSMLGRFLWRYRKYEEI